MGRGCVAEPSDLFVSAELQQYTLTAHSEQGFSLEVVIDHTGKETRRPRSSILGIVFIQGSFLAVMAHTHGFCCVFC